MRFTAFLIGLIFSSGTAVHCYDEDRTENCASGYKKADNGICIDIDECEILGSCSQICANEKGSFKCSCVDGYITDSNDGTRCKAEKEVNFLIRTYTHILKLYPLEMLYDITGVFGATLDYSYRAGVVFWSKIRSLRTSQTQEIYKAPISGNSNVTIIHRNLTVYGLTVDWIYDHIYWINGREQTIQLSNFEGQMTKRLTQSPANKLNEFRNIAVDPLRGWLFATCRLADRTSSIERIGMDGSRRQKIVTAKKYEGEDLTLDLIKMRIYWLDRKIGIVSCNYDGLQPQTLKHHCNLGATPTIPTSLTIFEDWIYFVDLFKLPIYKQHKFKEETRNCSDDIYSSDPVSGNMVSIKAYHPLIQPNGINFCDPNNGQCSHLCLPAPQFDSTSPKISCSCPDGFKLLSNGRTCVKEGY